MIKSQKSMDYNYFNRYLKNSGSPEPLNMNTLDEFFRLKFNVLPEHEIDPKEVVLLHEYEMFIRQKYGL